MNVINELISGALYGFGFVVGCFGAIIVSTLLGWTPITVNPTITANEGVKDA